MSFLTCFWLLPQNEHFSRSPPSPMRATRRSFRSVLLKTSPVRTPPAQLLLPCCCSALSRVDATCSRRPTLPLNAGVAPSSPWFRRGRTSLRPERTLLCPTANTPAPRENAPPSGVARGLATDQYLVDEAVLLGLVSGQDLVPLDVLLDLFHGAAGVMGQGLLQPGAHAQHLVGLDLEVAGHAAQTLHGRLVDQDPGVRQGETLAGRPCAEQHRRRGGSLADDERLDVGAEVLHRVVDRGHRGERATR